MLEFSPIWNSVRFVITDVITSHHRIEERLSFLHNNLSSTLIGSDNPTPNNDEKNHPTEILSLLEIERCTGKEDLTRYIQQYGGALLRKPNSYYRSGISPSIIEINQGEGFARVLKPIANGRLLCQT